MIRMLKFFKRTPPVPTQPGNAAPAPARPRPPGGSKSTAVPEPPPLPEVSEGNLDSDWALWEDSVAFQDSQMPSSFSELESVKERDKKTGGDKPDPFAAVRRRGA